MIEHYFTCPYCWEEQLKLLDISVTQQSFIEDCEVCCNPIEFDMIMSDNTVTSFSAQPIGQ
ncbi:MAG: CPXCG motif-containing cysteine-rich protein [Flavobacteriaceae bacterium]|nr:CPXCG motif-containing cysteine-rich protein [Flavobacteriaceae bacterium]MDG1962384.1 CPXCG motif-containing cysteine-rich protein [Flavobacteriaceae bacterium]